LTYDFAILGTGAAGLHLALAMQADPFFEHKTLLLIDKSKKNVNDKTWCFWEKGVGLWDHITYHQWERGLVVSETEISLNLAPYKYKMLRSIDFYNYAKGILNLNPNIHWVHEEVTDVSSDSPLSITTDQSTYQADWVFDSRIPTSFKPVEGYNMIFQHFKGWVIETTTPTFNSQQFSMMDFRVKWKDSACFTYVLPISSTEALIEFTMFTPYLIEDIGYDAMLNAYVEETMKLKNYEINAVEKGIIPMTDYPFHALTQGNHIKIGTAGSWLKPSSGYSFKNAERYSRLLLHYYKTNQPIPKLLASSKFRFYDKLFLDVLTHHNNLGEHIFYNMYKHNPTPRIFRFLDEQSSLWEDFQIISSLPKKPFLKALGRYLF